VGVYAAVYLALGLLESQRAVIAVFLVYGVYSALTEGAERALVADLVSAERLGSAFGTSPDPGPGCAAGKSSLRRHLAVLGLQCRVLLRRGSGGSGCARAQRSPRFAAELPHLLDRLAQGFDLRLVTHVSQADLMERQAREGDAVALEEVMSRQATAVRRLASAKACSSTRPT